MDSHLLNTYRHYRWNADGAYVPASFALAMARNVVGNGGRKYGKRDAGTVNRPFERGRSLYRWIENADSLWRREGFADECIRSGSRAIDHKGWFTDDVFQDETYRGVVYRLPARNGRSVFAYGYADPNNDGCALISNDLYIASEDESDDDAKHEAARLADGVAESFAESEREYRAAERDARHAFSEAAEIREQMREFVSELRDMRDVGLVNPRQYQEASEHASDCWSRYRKAMDKADDAMRYARKHHGICYGDVLE